jgi:hypothetical protein
LPCWVVVGRSAANKAPAGSMSRPSKNGSQRLYDKARPARDGDIACAIYVTELKYAKRVVLNSSSVVIAQHAQG